MNAILGVLGLLIFVGGAVAVYAWLRAAYIVVTLRFDRKPTEKRAALLDPNRYTDTGRRKLEQLKFHILLFIIAPTVPFILYTVASAVFAK